MPWQQWAGTEFESIARDECRLRLLAKPDSTDSELILAVNIAVRDAERQKQKKAARKGKRVGERASTDAQQAKLWGEAVADRKRSGQRIQAQAEPISETRKRRLMKVFLLRMPYLGPPQRVPAPERGPHPLDTQYTAAFERRKGLFHRLVRNPMSAKAGGMKARTIGKREAIRNHVEWWAETLMRSVETKRTSRASLVGAILRRCRMKYKTVSESTVRRVLKEMEMRASAETPKVALTE